MLTAVVTRDPQGIDPQAIRVAFVEADDGEMIDISECEFPKENPAVDEYPCQEGPNPILPELKELAWGGGSFIVLAVVMIAVLFPKLKQGMDARYNLIHGSHEQADSARAAARAEVAQYESSLATVKAEANERVDEARQKLEAERDARLAEVNAEIDAQRKAAAAQVTAAREAAEADVTAAVAAVTGRTLELGLGKTPDPAKVTAAVESTMQTGVSS